MKKILIGLGALALLVILSYVALSAFLSPERIKTTFLPTISDMLGREVRVNGDVSITLFPTFGLSLEQLIVENPKGQASGNMLEVEEARLAVAVLPLLKKELEIREFTLIKPKLDLVKMADGNANWDFAMATETTPVPASGTSAGTSAGASNTAAAPSALPLSDLRIGTISVKNGAINYHDRVTGSKIALKDANFSLKMPNLKATADIEGSALYDGEKLKGKVKLSTPYGLMHGDDATLKVDIASTMADVIAEATLNYNTTTPRPIAEVTLTQLNVARADFNTYGTGGLKVLLGSTKPEITANLDLKYMEVESAAVEATPQQQPTTATPAEFSWPDTPLDFEGLAAADVDANLKIEKIKANGRFFGPLVANLSIIDKRLSLGLKRFLVFDGNMTGETVLNARTFPATASFKLKIDSAELDRAIPDEAAIYGATGNIGSMIDLSTKGRSVKQFVEGLNGNVDLSLTQLGATKFDLPAVATKHLGALGPIVIKNVSEETLQSIKDKVTEVAFSTVFNKGIGDTVIRFGGPILDQGGAGVINLPAQDVSLRMNPLLKANKKLDIVLPFYIEGPLTMPAVKPDQEGIAQEVARQIGRAGANKLLEKALKKGDDKLGAFGSILKAATERQDDATAQQNEATEGSTNTQPDPAKQLQKALGNIFGKK